MNGKHQISVLFLMAVLVAGCGYSADVGGHESLESRAVGAGAPFTGTEDSLIGTWTQMPVTDSPVASDHEWSDPELMTQPLEIKADGTYDLADGLITGTWTYSGGEVTLMPDSAPGETLTWFVSQDGQRMEYLNKDGTVTTCIR